MYLVRFSEHGTQNNISNTLIIFNSFLLKDDTKFSICASISQNVTKTSNLYYLYFKKRELLEGVTLLE